MYSDWLYCRWCVHFFPQVPPTARHSLCRIQLWFFSTLEAGSSHSRVSLLIITHFHTRYSNKSRRAKKQHEKHCPKNSSKIHWCLKTVSKKVGFIHNNFGIFILNVKLRIYNNSRWCNISLFAVSTITCIRVLIVSKISCIHELTVSTTLSYLPLLTVNTISHLSVNIVCTNSYLPALTLWVSF